MNETLKTLLERRSIRAYRPERISEEHLEAILQAGVWAPSAKNQQSPVLVVVQDPETVALMSRLNAQIMGTENDPFYGAGTVVVVLADPKATNATNAVCDGALVMGNLMNAAHAEGVASCWIHRAKEVFASAEGQKILADLGITGDYEGIGNCILGYAAAEIPAPKARKENYVYYIK